MMLMSLKSLHFEQYDGEVNSKLSFFFFEITRYERYERWAVSKDDSSKLATYPKLVGDYVLGV